MVACRSTARQPHWYYIKRYPLGLDATVSDSQTMRFRNDTAHPVLIKSFASPGVVRFEIWSVPNGRTVTWSKPHVTNVVRGFDSVRYTSALAPGQTKRIEYPVDGKDVVVTRTVRDGSGSRRQPRHVRVALSPDGGHHPRGSLTERDVGRRVQCCQSAGNVRCGPLSNPVGHGGVAQW